MNRMILCATLLLTSLGAAAQTTPGTGAPPPPQGGGQGAQHFEAAKARHLEHIAKHIAELQQRQACIQAAQNHEALRACMPARH